MFATIGVASFAVTLGLLTTAPAASSAGFVLEWSIPVPVSTPNNDASRALVTSSAGGSRQAVSWVQSESSLTRAYVAVSDDRGATWDDSTALSEGGRNANNSDLAMTADGMNLVTGWSRFDGAHWRAQATDSSDGGSTWSTPATLSASGASIFVPDVAIAAQSPRRVMIWERDDNPRLVQVTVSDDSANWATTVDLSAGSGNAVRPKVAISDDGQQIISVWSKVISRF